MTIDETYQTIANEKPTVIYISGKTSTGKSTFGRKLHTELGYHVVGLEVLLMDMIQSRGLDERTTFHKVFYESGDSEEKTLFLEITDHVISDALTNGHPMVIEGAMANIDTLKRVMQPATSSLFLYFHPTNTDTYTSYLTSRFMESGEGLYAGLPRTFWDRIDPEEFKAFCKTRVLTDGLRDTVRQYALMAQKESLVRLDECRQRFDNITVVEVQ